MIDVDEARRALDYDPDTGFLTWKITQGKARKGNRAGVVAVNGYRYVTFKNVNHREHRLIWLIVTGKPPKAHIDHLNHVKDDNRWANLRDVDVHTNCQNIIKPNSLNKSGFLGVRKENNQYTAQIVVGGKAVRVGRFYTPEEAHEAYVKAKRELHPGNLL